MAKYEQDPEKVAWKAFWITTLGAVLFVAAAAFIIF